MRWGWNSKGTKELRVRGKARGWMILLTLTGLATLAFAGCASQAHVSATPSATKTVKTTPTITPTIGPTVTPAPTPLAITDLGQFRQKFQNAVYSGKWSNVVPYLSPEFSFQWPDAGSHLLMPYSVQNLRTIFENQGSWVDAGYYSSFFSCYAGTTPGNQVVAFLGQGGNYGGPFLMFGIVQWQGYWVVGWGFDNPIGSGDGISCHIEGA